MKCAAFEKSEQTFHFIQLMIGGHATLGLLSDFVCLLLSHVQNPLQIRSILSDKKDFVVLVHPSSGKSLNFLITLILTGPTVIYPHRPTGAVGSSCHLVIN